MRTAASSKILLVEAVCIRGDRIVLVRHRKMGWTLPGGHVEEGENLLSALRREIKEETGMTIDEAEEVLVDVYKNYEAHIFFCRVSGEGRVEDPDILEVGVFPMDEGISPLPSWQRPFVEAVKKLVHQER